MSNLIAWIIRAIPFGTIIMFGSMGEITTEKSGNLNLGVPGIMYLGGFAGFASSYFYEKNAADPKGWICVLLALTAAIAASMFGGLIFSFLTITLRANQNVTGLALSIFGTGIGQFIGEYMRVSENGYISVSNMLKGYFQNSPFPKGLQDIPVVGGILFGNSFFFYLAVACAVALYWYLNKTRSGLYLRSVGESPATADAAGINVTLYKYLSTCIGAGICGIGGLYYVLDYNQGIWATTGQIEALGWLAVALVIFTTWKPLNAIWGAYLFGMLYWLYQFLPTLLGITLASYMTDLVQMLPYVVTVLVLIAVSMRKKKEDQPPAHLGLPYFREER